MSEWQPIETAPKDGASILLAFPGYRSACIGSYYDHTEMRFGKVYRESAGWTDGSWPFLGKETPNPTHWMPLPELPK